MRYQKQKKKIPLSSTTSSHMLLYTDRTSAILLFMFSCFFLTDIDECEARDTCQHECRNTLGSYQCACPSGYHLMPNGKTCQGTEISLRVHKCICKQMSYKSYLMFVLSTCWISFLRYSVQYVMFLYFTFQQLTKHQQIRQLQLIILWCFLTSTLNSTQIHNSSVVKTNSICSGKKINKYC